MRPRFANPYAIPPGGKFFCEVAGKMYEGRNLQEICSKVRPAMVRAGIRGTAEELIAAYMCPRLGPTGSWFCKGDFKDSDAVRSSEAIDNSLPYGSRRVVPFDVIEKRLAICMACQKHYRGWCLTCNGHLDRVISCFNGSRPRLPEDVGTGVCKCARAYEMAIASVEYPENERIWEGVPETCWRKHDV